VVIDKTHLLDAVRYVTLNPVRAGLVKRAQDWGLVERSGDHDLHTFLGLVDEGNAGYSNISVQMNIDSDASPEALKALHDNVAKTSPVGHTLNRAVPVKFELVTT